MCTEQLTIPYMRYTGHKCAPESPKLYTCHLGSLWLGYRGNGSWLRNDLDAELQNEKALTACTGQPVMENISDHILRNFQSNQSPGAAEVAHPSSQPAVKHMHAVPLDQPEI